MCFVILLAEQRTKYSILLSYFLTDILIKSVLYFVTIGHSNVSILHGQTRPSVYNRFDSPLVILISGARSRIQNILSHFNGLRSNHSFDVIITLLSQHLYTFIIELCMWDSYFCLLLRTKSYFYR